MKAAPISDELVESYSTSAEDYEHMYAQELYKLMKARGIVVTDPNRKDQPYKVADARQYVTFQTLLQTYIVSHSTMRAWEILSSRSTSADF